MKPIFKSHPSFRVTALLVLSLSSPNLWAAAGPSQAHQQLARATLARMTLEEKLGQMTQAEHSALKDPNDIAKYHLGSLLSGGGSWPSKSPMAKQSGYTQNDPATWATMVAAYQKIAMSTRLGIPLLYGIDAVHGHNNVEGAVIFPHNVGLGAANNPALMREIGRVTADELRATGIQWNFAPTIAVATDLRWGRAYESFGDDPVRAGKLGRALLEGLQQIPPGGGAPILGCAKHFAGDGGTSWGTGKPRESAPTIPWGLDQGDTKLDEKEFRRLHINHYKQLINAGVGSIMPSFSSWNGVKCSGNRRLLTEILKGELGFKGFLISDWEAVNQLPGTYAEQIEASINAGMDMVMVPIRYAEFFDTLKQLVQSGRIPMSRIDDAVTRILTAKAQLGLLDRGYKPDPAPRELGTFGSKAHREVARHAVRESLVLLKNERAALPLSKRARRIHVAGKNADDLGNQCGGWTLSWQGQSGDVAGGTSIRKAIEARASVTYSLDGKGAEGADASVVVIGERPYTEFMGDVETLSLDPADVAAVRNARKAGAPVIVIIVSGRPLPLDAIVNEADAIVAAWLPGTEGAGVADVLFGDFPFKGRLPVKWALK